MNALKKIFLLSLLSVFFLSAFCQKSNSPEIIATINIQKSAPEILEFGNTIEEPILKPNWPKWWFLYRDVVSESGPGYLHVTCTGNGWRICMPTFRDILYLIFNRGGQSEIAEVTCENLVYESEELLSNGMYSGSLSKKIAFPEDCLNIFFFQMNWNNDPQNPYNGVAEIIISKTDNFGF